MVNQLVDTSPHHSHLRLLFHPNPTTLRPPPAPLPAHQLHHSHLQTKLLGSQSRLSLPRKLQNPKNQHKSPQMPKSPPRSKYLSRPRVDPIPTQTLSEEGGQV